MISRVSVVVAVAAVTAACRPSHDAGQTLLDDAGRPVADRPAERIVSLAPSLTELLFAIGAGDRLIGRTRWCDYPPQVADVPSVGDGLNPNIEVIAALRPDWVMLYASPSNDVAIGQLTELGIATLSLRTDGFDDLVRAARVLGDLTGTRQRADRLADSLTHDLEALGASEPSDARPSVAIVAWSDPPIVIGGASFLSEIVLLAGARNVFGDIERASATVSVEVIADRDPDILVMASDSTFPSWAERPEWQAVRAVRERRFAVVGGSEFNRPSFRGPDAVRRLRILLAEQTP